MSLRPRNTPKITPDDLMPGDVLLSSGAINPSNPRIAPPDEMYMSLLDFLLRKLDGGDYSHTSVYVGKDANGVHSVIEATTHGVKLNPISVDINSQVLVDAYRYVSPDGHKFGDPDWPVEPVLDHAKAFIGQPYSYSELLMGALILLKVDTLPEGAEQILVELAVRKFEAELASWIASLRGSKPMTCVQVATSSFYQAKAEPEHKYGLQVKITGNRIPPVANSSNSEFAKLQSRLREQILDGFPNDANRLLQSSYAGPSAVLTAGSAAVPLGTCTPIDMETSPTLNIVGCLLDVRTP